MPKPGDRRSESRFEIVGDLWGTLQLAAPCRVRDVAAHGIGVESTSVLEPGGTYHGILEWPGGRQPCHVLVRHARLSGSRQHPAPFLSGVEFLDRMPGVIDDLVDHVVQAGGVAADSPPDSTPTRRRDQRIIVPASEAIALRVSTRVRVVDVSEAGALLACGLAVGVGTRGALSTTFGSVPFAGDLVVRRQQPDPLAGRSVMAVGATFLSMDDRSRRGLEEFLRRR